MNQPSDRLDRIVPPPPPVSIPKPKSIPEATWVPPPSTPDLQLAPPRGSGYLAGALIGFILAGTAAVLVWLLLPEGLTRQQPAGHRDAAKALPATAPARPNERVQDREKQLTDLRRTHDELSRERDLLLAAKELAEQQLAALSKSLEAAKQKSPAQPTTAQQITQLTQERDALKTALESIAQELKTAPPEALKALIQLRATQKHLAAEKEELLAHIKAHATSTPQVAISGTVSSATTRPDLESAIPLLPGNSWVRPTPTPNPIGGPPASGAQRSDTAPIAGTTALGGQPIRTTAPTTRTAAPRTGVGY